MNNTHTEFERYYQQVRSRQKRDTFSWSLLLLALYFAAGSAAEFNLFTIWHSLPNFLDYMFETLPTLHVADLFADVAHQRLAGLLGLSSADSAAAYLGNAAAGAGVHAGGGGHCHPAGVPCRQQRLVPCPAAFCHPRAGGFLRTMPELAWAVIFVMAFGIGAIPAFWR
jgi:phosphonate transport system permease protein